ncbi:MAG TPA: energy transducer TonB [Polyangiales bacterium]
MCISLGAHMTIVGVLGFMPTAAKVFARQPIEIEVVPPPKVEPPPPPPPEKPPEPEAARPRPAPKPAAPKLTDPEPPKPAAPPPAAAEAPVDFTGVTLTADGNSTWASAVGNGKALTGPAPRVAAVTGRDRAGAADGVVGGGPALVNEASLSRKPVPPTGMDQLLEKNYPPRARAQGVSGTALLAVRIGADGRVGELRIIRETSDYGFGDACIKTLRGSRWQAPLDRRGNPVATDIRYSCDFEVGY